MQEISVNWTFFSLTLASTFVFGVLFAALVRWSAKKKMISQTAWAVAIGVTVTLLAMIPVFGLQVVAIMFCYFMASGIPMIAEYLLRVARDAEEDAEKAKGIAKDLFQ